MLAAIFAPPLLPFAIAADIGGGLNLWSNLGKVNNIETGVAYYLSGAAGGATSLTNPYLGGSITAAGNVGIDAYNGHLPDPSKPAEVGKYIAAVALDGLSAGSSGSIVKAFGWTTTTSMSGTVHLADETFGLSGGVVSADFTVTATKVPISGVAANATNVVYQGLDKASKVRYVGITARNESVRFAEHFNSKGGKELLRYETIEGAEGLTRTQANTLEQELINQYGLEKNGGLLINKINSIATKNWWQYGIR